MSTYKFELWNILKHPIKTNKFLILDTETTGINTKTSFILQLSYILSDYKFTYNKEDIKDYIIKIDSDVNITNSYIHGITKLFVTALTGRCLSSSLHYPQGYPINL